MSAEILPSISFHVTANPCSYTTRVTRRNARSFPSGKGCTTSLRYSLLDQYYSSINISQTHGFVCMVTHIARVWINRERLPSGQAEQGKGILPCPCSRLRIESLETCSVVPSRVSLLISIPRLNLVPTYGIPPEFRGGGHLFILNRHTPSGQPGVNRVTQLRTDGVHCREYAGTGPVNIRLSFPHPLLV